MDWIKVKVSHVLYEYNDLSDSEFRAWFKAMFLVAILEKVPTRGVLLQHINPRTLESLAKKFETHSISLETIMKKVYEDVLYNQHLRDKNRSKIAEYRRKKAETAEKSVTGTVPVTYQGKIREDKIREDKITTDKSMSAKKTADHAPQGFLNFWGNYKGPRKTGKTFCLEIWLKKNLEPKTEEILTGLKFWNNSPEWQKEGGQYIPLPATFLRQGRWIDAPKPPVTRQEPERKNTSLTQFSTDDFMSPEEIREGLKKAGL